MLARNCLFYKKEDMKTFYFKVKRVFETPFYLKTGDYDTYTTGMFLLFIVLFVKGKKNAETTFDDVIGKKS